MTAIETLAKQTIDANLWVEKLIANIPEEQWTDTPEGIQSNISWQIGHLIISIYYHTILVIKGHQPEIFQKVPIKEYADLFTVASIPTIAADKSAPSELKSHYAIITEASIKTIKSLSEEELNHKLVPGEVEHPVAKTKFEALDWNIKHTMWHCGQIATLKRVLGVSHIFELKKVSRK